MASNCDDTVKHNTRLSKALSWLLRHNLKIVSEITKKPIDPSGYVNVEDVLKLPRFAGYSSSQVEQVVKLNDKQKHFPECSDYKRSIVIFRSDRGAID